MSGSACLALRQARRPAQEPAKFLCRAKHGHSPGRITKPAANTAVCCPKAPAPEFADDKPSAGLEHAGHFGNRSFGISNEAKHGHRKDKVESRVFERQCFCLPLNETVAEWPRFRSAVARQRSSQGLHRAPLRLRHVEQVPMQALPSPQPTSSSRFAGNRTSKFEEELLLQRIGNLAETARSPPGVGSGQPFCRLRSAHEAVRMAVPLVLIAGLVIPQRQVHRSDVRPLRRFRRASLRARG